MKRFAMLALAVLTVLVASTPLKAGPIRDWLAECKARRDARRAPTTCETSRPAVMAVPVAFGQVIRSIMPAAVGMMETRPLRSIFGPQPAAGVCYGPNCRR